MQVWLSQVYKLCPSESSAIIYLIDKKRLSDCLILSASQWDQSSKLHFFNRKI